MDGVDNAAGSRRVAADVVAFGEGGVLLVKRKFPPDVGAWATPGGYVEANETVEEAAAREFLEETGLAVRDLRLLTVQSTPDRHPRQLISIVFTGYAEGTPRAGDDAADAAWFALDDLPQDIALDHRDTIGYASEDRPDGRH